MLEVELSEDGLIFFFCGSVGIFESGNLILERSDGVLVFFLNVSSEVHFQMVTHDFDSFVDLDVDPDGLLFQVEDPLF